MPSRPTAPTLRARRRIGFPAVRAALPEVLSARRRRAGIVASGATVVVVGALVALAPVGAGPAEHVGAAVSSAVAAAALVAYALLLGWGARDIAAAPSVSWRFDGIVDRYTTGPGEPVAREDRLALQGSAHRQRVAGVAQTVRYLAQLVFGVTAAVAFVLLGTTWFVWAVALLVGALGQAMAWTAVASVGQAVEAERLAAAAPVPVPPPSAD